MDESSENYINTSECPYCDHSKSVEESTEDRIYKIVQGANTGDAITPDVPNGGDRTNSTQLMNGQVNFSITTSVYTDRVFNYGQFVDRINFGISRDEQHDVAENELCGQDIVLNTDTAAMYLSEYRSYTPQQDVHRLHFIDAVKILDYDGIRQDIPYGQVDSDGDGNIHGSLRFQGCITFNNGRRLDECYGKDVVFKTDQCRKVTWNVQLKNVINETLNHKADSCGNVYVVGAYQKQLIAHGNVQLVSTRMKQNMFLMKIDNCGQIQWTIDANDRPNRDKCNYCSHTCNNVCYLSSNNKCKKKCRKCPDENLSMDNYVDSPSLTLTRQDECPVVVGSYTRHVTFDHTTLLNKVSRANAYVAEFTTEGKFVCLYGPEHCPLPNNSNCTISPSEHFLLGESIDVDANDQIFFTGSMRGRYRFERIHDYDSVVQGNDIGSVSQAVYLSRLPRGEDDPVWNRLIIANVPPNNAFHPNVSTLQDGRSFIAIQTQGTVHFIDGNDAIVPHFVNEPQRVSQGSGTTDLFSSFINNEGDWTWIRKEVGTVNNSSEHIAANDVYSHLAGSFIINEYQVDPFVAQVLG